MKGKFGDGVEHVEVEEEEQTDHRYTVREHFGT